MIRCKSIDARRCRRLLSAFLFAGVMWASEATAETYVILSLIGDHLTIASQRRQTGSHIDVNDYKVVPMAAPAFDDFAVRVADATIAKTRKDAAVVTVRAGAQSYKAADSWLDADLSGVAGFVSAIKAQLPPVTDAHLLLIAPYRDQPKFKFQEVELGSGKVSGLGFYVDTTTWVRNLKIEESARGYLGVFAHCQLVLINLESDAIEAHERIVLGSAHAASLAPTRLPWDALDERGKARALESLLKQGIESSLPGMLSSKKM